MNLQAQRDLSIAGNVVGRDKITINITRGLDELPTRYDGRVQNFLEYYLGAFRRTSCAKPPAPSSIPPSGGREKPSGLSQRRDGTHKYTIPTTA